MKTSAATAALNLIVFSALVMFVDYGLTEGLSTEGELSSFLIIC